MLYAIDNNSVIFSSFLFSLQVPLTLLELLHVVALGSRALRIHWNRSCSMKSWVYLLAPTCLNFNVVCVYFVILLHNNDFWNTSSSLSHTVHIVLHRLSVHCALCLFAQVRDGQQLLLRAPKFLVVVQLNFYYVILSVLQRSTRPSIPVHVGPAVLPMWLSSRRCRQTSL